MSLWTVNRIWTYTMENALYKFIIVIINIITSLNCIP